MIAANGRPVNAGTCDLIITRTAGDTYTAFREASEDVITIPKASVPNDGYIEVQLEGEPDCTDQDRKITGEAPLRPERQGEGDQYDPRLIEKFPFLPPPHPATQPSLLPGMTGDGHYGSRAVGIEAV